MPHIHCLHTADTTRPDIAFPHSAPNLFASQQNPLPHPAQTRPLISDNFPSRTPINHPSHKVPQTKPAIVPTAPAKMTASTTSPAPAAQPNDGKRQVKILMLHGTQRNLRITPTRQDAANSSSSQKKGFTQSGSLFRAKTRALEKLLAKVLSPISLTPHLIYPTAPTRLSPQDIPGFVLSADADADFQPDTWAWWRGDDGSGEYLLLERGMAVIAEAIREVGGVDGVCGFSQGGAATGLVAAALEPERAVLEEGEAGAAAAAAAGWVHRLREANGGRPLKFAVSYSGFWAVPQSLQFLYEPKIETPIMHYLGSLDTVVGEDRSRAFIDKCANATTVVHPGGHHVPVSKEWAMPLAGFIKHHAQDLAPKICL